MTSTQSTPNLGVLEKRLDCAKQRIGLAETRTTGDKVSAALRVFRGRGRHQGGNFSVEKKPRGKRSYSLGFVGSYWGEVARKKWYRGNLNYRERGRGEEYLLCWRQLGKKRTSTRKRTRNRNGLSIQDNILQTWGEQVRDENWGEMEKHDLDGE